jgi:hypothetical protein
MRRSRRCGIASGHTSGAMRKVPNEPRFRGAGVHLRNTVAVSAKVVTPRASDTQRLFESRQAHLKPCSHPDSAWLCGSVVPEVPPMRVRGIHRCIHRGHVPERPSCACARDCVIVTRGPGPGRWEPRRLGVQLAARPPRYGSRSGSSRWAGSASGVTKPAAHISAARRLRGVRFGVRR